MTWETVNNVDERCLSCCQENCGYGPCECYCHNKVERTSSRDNSERPTKNVSLREAIKGKIGTRVMTATALAHDLGEKTASVSSLLHKMTEAGEILRIKGFGTRGGYGYLLKQRRDGR